MMYGMNRINGQSLSDVAHIRQSIADIVTTPVGSRVMRRDYGCNLFRWVDAPTTEEFRLRTSAYVMTAIKRWESRVIVDRVIVALRSDGVVAVDLSGRIVSTGSFYSQHMDASS